MKNFLFTLYVCSVPKKHLNKFSTIYRENLKFSLQNCFLKMFLRFFIPELFAD